MADVAPPTPPAPKAAAKGLAGIFKGKPAWVWIAGVTVLIGVAYLTMKGNKPAATEDTADGVDPGATGDMANGDYGGYYPVATEGAYGGSDIPFDYGTVSDNAGTPEPGPATVVNVNYPAPPPATVTGGGKPAATGAGTHAPPASAKPKTWRGPDGKQHPLSWWQSPVHNRKRVNGRYRWRWPGGGGYVHTRAYAGH